MQIVLPNSKLSKAAKSFLREYLATQDSREFREKLVYYWTNDPNEGPFEDLINQLSSITTDISQGLGDELNKRPVLRTMIKIQNRRLRRSR